jgi:glycosidase
MLLPLLLACRPPQGLPDRQVEPQLIYFALVDRFDNGDPSNDGAVNLADPMGFHGGDLAGVQRRLPELGRMGVDTIWLSPIFEMRREPIGGWGAFHGYWVRDLQKVDPHLGGEEALDSLLSAAHARGMKVVLDMVWNHTDYDAPLRQQHPDWFHPAVDIARWEDPVERVERQVHGLPDLAQEKEEVHRYLLESSLPWVERGVDGFRVDAVRHMPADFLARIGEELPAELWMLGEDFEGDPGRLSRGWAETRFDSVFDFPLRYAAIDVICKGQHAGRLASALSADRLYARPESLVTFLDNHDLPRLMTECQGSEERTRLALGLIFALRGIPCISWGTEFGLQGAGEPENRASLPWEQQPPLAGLIAELSALRRAHPALRAAGGRFLELEPQRLTLLREAQGEQVLLDLDLATPPPDRSGEGWRLLRRMDQRCGMQSCGLALWARSGELPAARPARVELLLRGLEAQRVQLVGTAPELGGWDPEGAPQMQWGPAGEWSLGLELPLGSAVGFKILADGKVWLPAQDIYLRIAEGPVILEWSAELGEMKVRAAR